MGVKIDLKGWTEQRQRHARRAAAGVSLNQDRRGGLGGLQKSSMEANPERNGGK